MSHVRARSAIRLRYSTRRAFTIVAPDAAVVALLGLHLARRTGLNVRCDCTPCFAKLQRVLHVATSNVLFVVDLLADECFCASHAVSPCVVLCLQHIRQHCAIAPAGVLAASVAPVKSWLKRSFKIGPVLCGCAPQKCGPPPAVSTYCAARA